MTFESMFWDTGAKQLKYDSYQSSSKQKLRIKPQESSSDWFFGLNDKLRVLWMEVRSGTDGSRYNLDSYSNDDGLFYNWRSGWQVVSLERFHNIQELIAFEFLYFGSSSRIQ